MTDRQIWVARYQNTDMPAWLRTYTPTYRPTCVHIDYKHRRIHTQIYIYIYRHKYRHTYNIIQPTIHPYRLSDLQTCRHTHRDTRRQTQTDTDRHRHRQTHVQLCIDVYQFFILVHYPICRKHSSLFVERHKNCQTAKHLCEIWFAIIGSAVFRFPKASRRFPDCIRTRPFCPSIKKLAAQVGSNILLL